jgi:hypothetical protein
MLLPNLKGVLLPNLPPPVDFRVGLVVDVKQGLGVDVRVVGRWYTRCGWTLASRCRA